MGLILFAFASTANKKDCPADIFAVCSRNKLFCSNIQEMYNTDRFLLSCISLDRLDVPLLSQDGTVTPFHVR